MKKPLIAIASDHAGFELKQLLKHDIEQQADIEDLGTHDTSSVDYPDYAAKLAQWIAVHPDGKGILICGSGIGMSIAANRHKEVRAALCRDGLEAQLSRRHNNANVLCLGARIIGPDVARDCIKQFLHTEFEGGRHAARVEKLNTSSSGAP